MRGSSKTDGFQLASEHLIDATEEIKKQAMEYSDDLIDSIKERPIKSLIIASAIGLLIGKFLL